jgi:hypothetical protein
VSISRLKEESIYRSLLFRYIHGMSIVYRYVLVCIIIIIIMHFWYLYLYLVWLGAYFEYTR